MGRAMRPPVRASTAVLAAVLLLPGAGAAHASAADRYAAVGSPRTDFAAAGAHTLVVLPVYWTAPDAQTTTTLRGLARQVGDYWTEQTGGAITVPDAKITVNDWTRIPDPGMCDKESIFYAARDAAGVHAGTYHKHVIV